MAHPHHRRERIVTLGGIAFSLLLLLILILQRTDLFSPFSPVRMFFLSGGFQMIVSACVLIYFFFAWQHLRVEKEHQIVEKALIGNSSLGQIQISSEAIKDVVKRVGRHTLGVKGMSVKVKDVGDGIAILAKIEAEGEGSLPNLGASLQEKIQQKLEAIAGVKVKEVRVIVDAVEVLDRARSRVR